MRTSWLHRCRRRGGTQNVHTFRFTVSERDYGGIPIIYIHSYFNLHICPSLRRCLSVHRRTVLNLTHKVSMDFPVSIGKNKLLNPSFLKAQILQYQGPEIARFLKNSKKLKIGKFDNFNMTIFFLSKHSFLLNKSDGKILSNQNRIKFEFYP